MNQEKVLSLTVQSENAHKTAYRQIISYDSEGRLLASVTTKPKSKNGGGFVLSYTEKMCEFLEKATQGSVVRIFLYIAHHQNYGVDGVFGYRCSHKYLQQVLRLDRKTVYRALDQLKEDFLVNEIRVGGVSEFMVNPNYVTTGSDKKMRMNEWNRRWAEHWKDKHIEPWS